VARVIYALAAAVLALLGVALAARLLSARAGRGAGLPRGQVVYSDTGHAVGKLGPTVTDEQGVRQERPLVSRRHGLTGRPDYLIRTREGIVPVEAKSAAGPADGRPYDSHVFQLAAYCLLVEDEFGAPVPYGLIRYRDAEARVEFTTELREQLLALLEEIREARAAEEVHRSHDEPRRCARCGVRDSCDERLD
jgi:CRISPR-associated exonuclease Cas4